MGSENPTSGDDQQETRRRPLDPMWVVGFVDGEGCFSVSIHRNPYARRTRGWQIAPVFHVYQHEKDREVLEDLRVLFGCGYLRSKGPNSDVLTYAVHARRDLERAILPFFERYRPRVKRRDFESFATIVRSMQREEHFTDAGFERIVHLAYSMNGSGKQRARPIDVILQGSSETARQARLDLGREETERYSPILMAT